MRDRVLSLPMLLATLAPLAVCDAQVTAAVSRPASNAWIASVNMSCGQVHGRIISWPMFSGDTVPAPVAGAMIEFVDSASKRIQGQPRAWASSNTAGEFQLDLPRQSTGFAFLLIRAIGYEPAVLALDPNRYRAYALEISLSSQAFHNPQEGLGVQAVRGIRLCLP